MAPKSPKVIKRQLDTDSLARFMELVAICENQHYELAMNCIRLRTKTLWLVHLFRLDDAVVASGRGETMGTAVVEAHKRLFEKNRTG